ncbi:unnamed protein product [Ostreobium quekettii]|uniref:RRM domain-containing protein n=1 Tax=Ostreobium quekettii TaxID=121088 RepID=A0A8S1JAV7_9CHLO|nr:unnamed protein product [Ostreobium quekettii]|eukprot:evm.model.scf_837.5 EVM.evm.TU.scf_837.5   scf_837:45334-50721(-)
MAEFDEYDYLEKQLEQKENDTANNDYRHRPPRHEDERRPRPRDRERKRSRSRPREPERGRGERARRQSPPRGYRDGRDRGGTRRRRDDYRGKRRSLSRERRKERTPPEVRAAREREKELRELERDTRTIFAYNLNLRADERDIFDFFSKAGTVMDVKIIMDRNTRKSKGFAYVEFEKQEDVLNALALTGQVLMGQAVMVKASEAEKNLAWEAQQQQQQNQAAAAALLGTGLGTATGPCKLSVEGLHPDISESDLRKIFEPFGELDFIQLAKDGSGNSQGYGFVQFKLMSDATKAMQQLNGLEIGGTALKVSIASVSSGEAGIAGIGELDEEDEMGGGMRLSSHARAALMNRLANSAGLQPTSAFGVPGLSGVPQVNLPSAQLQMQMQHPMVLEQGLLGPASPIPTQCLLIKNMFDPTQESEPDWDKEIGDDVRDECSKYGEVSHVHVDRNSKGFVYLRFVTQEGAEAAQKALHGRWFAGRQIVAEYQFTQVYNSHFGV